MSTELILSGLNGSNPLAFLAALGALRVLTIGLPSRELRLAWRANGKWMPILIANALPAERDVICHYLARILRALPIPGSGDHLPRNLNAWSNADFRRFAESALSDCFAGNIRSAEFASAYSCDGLVTELEKIPDTAFRTLSGSGHQDLFPTLEQLQEETTARHLRRTLFEEWDYADERLSLRYDPIEDRRYALRWRNPSDESSKTMWGANRLAFEALPLFPVTPVNQALATTGFTSKRGQRARWTWPVWEGALTLDCIRSVVALAELQEERPDRLKLAAMGVLEVFRSERITVDKFRNFTPAQPV